MSRTRCESKHNFLTLARHSFWRQLTIIIYRMHVVVAARCSVVLLLLSLALAIGIARCCRVRPDRIGCAHFWGFAWMRDRIQNRTYTKAHSKHSRPTTARWREKSVDFARLSRNWFRFGMNAVLAPCVPGGVTVPSANTYCIMSKVFATARSCFAPNFCSLR